MRTAVVTGASRGLGLALTRALVARGWRVVVDARLGSELSDATGRLGSVVPVVGDVTDPRHRAELVRAAGESIELVVNNASSLGARPRPALADYPLDELRDMYDVNVVAPLALIQEAL